MSIPNLKVMASDPQSERPLKLVSDRELLNRIKREKRKDGNLADYQDCFRELWYRIQLTYSWRIKIRLRYDWYDANDIAHAASAKIVKKVHKFIPLATYDKFHAAFAKAEINRLTQKEYRHQRKHTQMLEDTRDPIEQSPDDLLELYEKSIQSPEFREAFQQELRRLPKNQRDCIHKKLALGITIKALAENYSVSEKTISRWINDARDTITEGLKQRNFLLPVSVVGVLLALHSDASAIEHQISQLGEAMPTIASTGRIPDGAMTPAAKAIYLASEPTASWSLVSWWAAGSVALVAAPVSGFFAVAFWSQYTDHVVTPLAHPSQAKVEQVQQQVVVDTIPQPEETKPFDKNPGGFPKNPEPGQVHTVKMPQLTHPISFCWVPPGNTPKWISTGVVIEGKPTTGFWIGQTELTQAQWKMANDFQNQDFNPSWFRGDDLPVEQVTYNDALAYCKRFETLTGISVRLPTFAEWQYAASFGLPDSTTELSDEDVGRCAWFEANSGGQTHKVGMLEPTALNLFDIFGNVREYTQPLSWDTTEEPSSIPILGASWSYPALFCQPFYPAIQGKKIRMDSGTGFRIVFQPNDGGESEADPK